MQILPLKPKSPGPGHAPRFQKVEFESLRFRAMPIAGRVAAGKPIETLDLPYGVEAMVDVPSTMMGSGEHYVLQVVGDSMMEEGILHGDYVIVKKQSGAANGQTVVAMVNGDATVKRYYHKTNRIELHPANPVYRPIVVKDLTTFQIDGVVVGVIRHLESYLV